MIKPLPLNRKAAAKRSPRTLWKAALALGTLASVLCGSGFLLNHLSKRSPPELIETTAPVPGKPGTPQPVQAAEEKGPLPPEKGAKEEPRPPVAAQNQGAAETKAESALKARREKDQGDRKSLEERFHRHLSGGLTAYHEKNFALARSELTKAQELKPNAREVHESLAQVEAAVRLQSMGDIQARAAEAEALEDWAKASDLYAAALALDRTLQFAVQGRERALERMEIDKRLQFYLQKPQALESDESLARAAEVLNRAEGIEPKGLRLNHQLEALRQLVKEAQLQIRVTLVSDNLTEVSVYRVGRLGRFTAHELLLRPGRYTVVGTREGYKDVRQEILVKPGEAPLQVTIACREKV
jgi:tetratricopeptide (TPR) repeat protein